MRLPLMPERWVREEPYVKIAIVLLAGAALWSILASGLLWSGFGDIVATPRSRSFWISMLSYGGLMYLAFGWRVSLWLRYRPMESVDDASLPSVSVVIPAYNEGPLVRQSILSAAASRYPADRIEIIAIDDGSDDDTWSQILAAARDAGDRVSIRTVRQPRNTGKRAALCRGFAVARGDVFITTDSDSVLEPDAVRNAVSPLVRDSSIGCVAGCVRVLNPRQSVLTRFLKCTFSLSFRFVRAYQNEFGGIFCTPGALSAYRADFVRRVADEWRNQRFCGRACVTGEDRAMTNLFLRDGWLTAYQDNAVVYARMPHTYKGLTGMFLRWARSNIRETVILFRFLFTRFRTRHLQAFRLNMCLATLSLVLPPVIIAGSLSLMLTQDGYLLRHAAVVILYAVTMSAVYFRNERDSDWVWLFLYQFFWVACLSWIIPYAAMTLRNTGWLTRGHTEDTDDRDAEIVRSPATVLASA
ncbi:MAG: glycosyltransferase [Planctomycetota bacterium]|nr:glycosyltransferase [Planctomycetota bacterium]